MGLEPGRHWEDCFCQNLFLELPVFFWLFRYKALSVSLWTRIFFMTFHITVLMQELANYDPQANFSQPSDFILPRTKNSFYFYKWLKKIKGILFHAMWKLYEIRISVFINSFTERQPHSLIYVLSMSLYRSRVERMLWRPYKEPNKSINYTWSKRSICLQQVLALTYIRKCEWYVSTFFSSEDIKKPKDSFTKKSF